MQRTELRPGYEISRLIKGGWQLAGGHGAVDRQQALDDMTAYAEAGFLAFDCADIYTGVESLIGAWRANAAAETRGHVKIHTKFVPDLAALPTLSRADVRALIHRSLQRLGQERLDLVQFHWWDYATPRYVDTALWLAELQAEGCIDLLGATNFDAARTQEMLDAGVRFATTQVQYSLLDDRPAGALSVLCARHGLRLLCYGTVAGGFLSERWHGAVEPRVMENRSLAKYKLVIDDAGGWAWLQALLDALTGVAQRHRASIGAVATRWVLDRPYAAAAIVGVRSTAHLAAHAGIADLVLDAQDYATIDAVRAQRHALDGDVYTLERDRSGRHGRIMKYDLSQAATQG